jgi:hypothetical protein
VLTTTDINGGTVDGAVIGGSSAAAGTFTTVTSGLGAVGTPSITFTGDTNTGMWSPAADTIAFSEGGVEAMRITSTGAVGIGTTSPSNLLTVKSASTASAAWFQTTGASEQTITLGDPDTIANDCGVYGRTTGNFVFQNSGGTFVWKYASGTERMRIDASGNLGIGTSSPSGRLHVEAGSVTQNLIAPTGNGTFRMADSPTGANRKEFTIILDNTNNQAPFHATTKLSFAAMASSQNKR